MVNERRTRVRICPSSPRKVVVCALAVVVAGCTTGNSTQVGGTTSDPAGVTTATTLRSGAPVSADDPGDAAPTSAPTSVAPTTSTTTADATPATPSTTLPGLDAGGITFTMLDRGAEPRQTLRYDVAPGTQRYDITESQVLVQDIEGLPTPNEIATSLVTELSTDVVVRDGGSFDLVTSTIGVEAGDDTADSIGAASVLREPLRSIITTTTVSDRGVKLSSSSTGLEALAALGPQFESLVSDPPDAVQAAIPLPVEAVGVGARWTVASDQTVGGFRVVETLTFEIVSIDQTGDETKPVHLLELEISGSQISNSQEVPNPGVPDSTISVDVWDITISGGGTVSTDRFVNPLTQVVSGQQILTITQGTLETSVDQTLTSTIEIRPE